MITILFKRNQNRQIKLVKTTESGSNNKMRLLKIIPFDMQT